MTPALTEETHPPTGDPACGPATARPAGQQGDGQGRATEASPQCSSCGERLHPREGGPGRRRQYCSATCRSRARRQRQAGAVARIGLSPFANALAEAVAGAGIPLVTLAEVMAEDGCRVSPSTLSNWQTGKNLPHNTRHDRNILLSLERALGLDPGALVLPWRQLCGRRATIPTVPRGHDLPARWARLERRICGHPGGAASRQALVPIREYERYVVGPDRCPRYSTIALEVQALDEGIDTYWYVVQLARGEDVRVRAGRGCQYGTRLDDQSRYPEATERLVATELLLDEPLAAGQICRLSFTVTHVETQPATMFRRVLASPSVRDLELAIEFHPSAAPARLTQRVWGVDLARLGDGGPAAPGQTSDRIRLVNPPVRGYGWAWDWPSADRPAGGLPA
jgi:hypothetical protein